jgi:hypothetical protein
MLRALEHTYDCKFFTGTPRGLASLNGMVPDENVKLLAVKRAADHPNVRGVINHIHVSGRKSGIPHQPFLRPLLGETIYFLDGPSGVVKQVVINPNNRRVIAVIRRGPSLDPLKVPKALNKVEIRSPERFMVIPMDLVRFLTRDSGFFED